MKKRKLVSALQKLLDRPDYQKLKDIPDYNDELSPLSPSMQRLIKRWTSLGGSAKHKSFSASGGTQKGAAMRPVREEICRRGDEIKRRTGYSWDGVYPVLLEELEADEQKAREAGDTKRADFLKGCQKKHDWMHEILVKRPK